LVYEIEEEASCEAENPTCEESLGSGIATKDSGVHSHGWILPRARCFDGAPPKKGDGITQVCGMKKCFL